MQKLLSTLFISLILFSQTARSEVAPLGRTPLEEAKGIQHNRKLQQRIYSLVPQAQLNVERPFSELDKTGYLLFHSDNRYGTEVIKDALASNLPAGVKLIVYTDFFKFVPSLRAHYEPLTGKNNLDVVALSYPNSDRAIWARDNTPIPVLLSSTSTNGAKWGVIDAVYFGGDEPDAALANFFHIDLGKNPYEFEGGNFVTDQKGNCVIVNKKTTAQIPDSVFTGVYGCKKLIRLKHVSGIGHADERVKFITDSTVLTDTPAYVPQLASLGYEVQLLPTPVGGRYRTYVNSLMIENKIFVPVFDEATDAEALAVYGSFGLEVVPLNSENISDYGNGSIHCITMTYPKLDISDLKRLLFR